MFCKLSISNLPTPHLISSLSVPFYPFSHRLREGKPLVGERANQKARIGDYADNPAPSKGS